MKIVVACSKLWVSNIAEDLRQRLNAEVVLVTDKDQLNVDFLRSIKPDYVFFPHWSYILKSEIYNEFKCIMFHMTDLPFGRGGSPLQNLISRGITKTKMSAFLCDGGVDTGPVYLKCPLDLKGSAQEIFKTATHLIVEMIEKIVKTKPEPKAQAGEITEFKRRKPEESKIESAKNLVQLYDFIRMLDAEGYPKAFINLDEFIIEFSGAELNADELTAKITVKKTEKKNA